MKYLKVGETPGAYGPDLQKVGDVTEISPGAENLNSVICLAGAFWEEGWAASCRVPVRPSLLTADSVGDYHGVGFPVYCSNNTYCIVLWVPRKWWW